ncbi:MAG: transposase [Deltaproteobacteria bacterium]|nr:transposase [Deltaproteobacteria bacterium]
MTDSWFGNQGLWKPVRQVLGERFHLLSRLRSNNVLYDQPGDRKPGQRGKPRKYGQRLGSATEVARTVQQWATNYSVHLYGKQRQVLAYDRIVLLKTLKCPVRVVWVFRKTQWVALFTTDLELPVTQMIEYYGARWKIESGFKELKQEIGSSKSQCRNAQAVTNHLNFCMMASTVTWIYVDRLKANPERRHKVKGRTSFAFSDIRRIIAEAALDEDFGRVCPKPGNHTRNSLVAVLLRMVA